MCQITFSLYLLMSKVAALIIKKKTALIVTVYTLNTFEVRNYSIKVEQNNC